MYELVIDKIDVIDALGNAIIYTWQNVISS